MIVSVTFIDAKKDRNFRMQNSHRLSINDVTNDGVERNGSEAYFTKRRKKIGSRYLTKNSKAKMT